MNGLIGTIGDKSNYSLECIILGEERIFESLNFEVGKEFIFFGGTRIIMKGTFFKFFYFIF